MSTMDDLQNLATLKRQATSLPGLQRYRDQLYRTTDALTEPGAYALQAALILDAVIDRIARDTPERPLERSHTPEQPTGAPEPHQTLTGAHSSDWDACHAHRHHAHE